MESVQATKPDRAACVRMLADLLKAAHAAAVAVAEAGAGEDGGSCNFDTPAFRVDGMQKTTIQKAAEMAGVKVMDIKWLGGQVWFWLIVPTPGMADRRTRCMEAAQRLLNQAAEAATIPGFRACGYYQCD